MNSDLDLKYGGEIETDQGMIEIPPHSCREYLEVWGNGACIEILVYPEPRKGHDKSDLVQIMLTDASGDKQGWMVNGQDIIGLINGLSRALQILIEREEILIPDDETEKS